jgi:hypothetical protein
MAAEVESWLAAQEKLPNGKVDGHLLIAEGKKRGYCICPKPMRQMISFDGMQCTNCQMTETRGSWEFWHGNHEPAG